MSSVVDSFVSEPSVEALDKCNKEHLVAIADRYGVELSADIKKLKPSIFSHLKVALIEQGVTVVKVDAPSSPGESVASGESQTSEIRLKELAVQEKQMQLEATKIRADREAVAAKEKQLELELKKLEFEREQEREKLAQEREERAEHERDRIRIREHEFRDRERQSLSLQQKVLQFRHLHPPLLHLLWPLFLM